MGYPAYCQGSDSEPAEIHWTNLPGELKQELLSYARQYASPPPGELDGPCCWLDQVTGLCKHHQDRPNVCRDFAVGGGDCLAWRKFYREKIETGDPR